ncbi:hypothetical protein AC96_5029 [Escherichia coli 2-156-04_S4_C2]|nr:hypothetical protein AC96_5029 [Escherichia coli 2-156-04_S4_C2]
MTLTLNAEFIHAWSFPARADYPRDGGFCRQLGVVPARA